MRDIFRNIFENIFYKYIFQYVFLKLKPFKKYSFWRLLGLNFFNVLFGFGFIMATFSAITGFLHGLSSHGFPGVILYVFIRFVVTFIVTGVSFAILQSLLYIIAEYPLYKTKFSKYRHIQAISCSPWQEEYIVLPFNRGRIFSFVENQMLNTFKCSNLFVNSPNSISFDAPSLCSKLMYSIRLECLDSQADTTKLLVQCAPVNTRLMFDSGKSFELLQEVIIKLKEAINS
jgi:hypothetical protein